jgi:hypothetical protein
MTIKNLQQKLQQNDSEKWWNACEWIVAGFWQIVLEGGETLCYQLFHRMPGVYQAFTLENGAKLGGSIPAIGSTSNCWNHNGLGVMESTADTKTDTKFPTRSLFGVTGVNSPSAR